MEPRWGHLIDYTYDGVRRNAQLSLGLGQLVDGVKGADNFSHNNGFEWVGWKSMNGDLNLEFTFKTVRNFTGALFHSNNLFSAGVEVFQAVDVHYGIDAQLALDPLRDGLQEQRRRDAILRHQRAPPATSLSQLEPSDRERTTMWSEGVHSIEYEPDKKHEHSRPVTVHLRQRLANKLRFVLKFASKWILISEVEFLSHPVELLSLSSLSDPHTPPAMSALSQARSYDQFVAILREHQLRRDATNAILASQINQPTSNSLSPELGDQSADSSAGSSSSVAPTSVRQPADRFEPSRINSLLWPPLPDPFAPSTNPMLSPPAPFSPPIYAPGAAQLEPTEQSGNQLANNLEQRQRLGLATVISFVLVSILVFLALLFAISSWRLRQQPKLGSPLPRHLSQAGKSLVTSPGLQNLMNVFSSGSPGGASATTEQSSSSISNGQQQPYDNHYNTLFAPSTVRGRASTVAPLRAASTLKRLANLTGGQTCEKPKQNLFATSQMPNQLLVSIKDSSNSQLFSRKTPNGCQVNTQLIVGLNQANPMAQQQIYNNSSNLNCSNQTYATHYSTGMSMASSSTTGHHGDYGDYAIPDAQPIIPSRLTTQLQHNTTQQRNLSQQLQPVNDPSQHLNHYYYYASNDSANQVRWNNQQLEPQNQPQQ